MRFFKKKENAKEANPDKQSGNKGSNPYLNARLEWLERYGSYMTRAANWRAVAFIAMVATLLSLCGNVIQATQVKTVPYIIEVDRLGRPAIVGRADKVKSPPLRLVQAAIAQCITDWRTVTADVELQKQMINRASFYFTGAAKGILKEWYTQNSPYEIAKTGKLVHVEIKSLPLQLSNDTYRIEWIETVRTHTGVTLETTSYEASVTVIVVPPTTEEVLLRNPAGVNIVEISANKIFGA